MAPLCYFLPQGPIPLKVVASSPKTQAIKSSPKALQAYNLWDLDLADPFSGHGNLNWSCPFTIDCSSASHLSFRVSKVFDRTPQKLPAGPLQSHRRIQIPLLRADVGEKTNSRLLSSSSTSFLHERNSNVDSPNLLVPSDIPAGLQLTDLALPLSTASTEINTLLSVKFRIALVTGGTSGAVLMIAKAGDFTNSMCDVVFLKKLPGLVTNGAKASLVVVPPVWNASSPVNTTAHYFLSVALPNMLALAADMDMRDGSKGWIMGGVVVVTSSVASFHHATNVDMISYASTKAVADQLVGLLAAKYSRCPIGTGRDAGILGYLVEKVPAKRAGSLGDLAGTVLFLDTKAGS
ncbi:unnamed protein product [Diplocarpon coronariae]